MERQVLQAESAHLEDKGLGTVGEEWGSASLEVGWYLGREVLDWEATGAGPHLGAWPVS